MGDYTGKRLVDRYNDCKIGGMLRLPSLQQVLSTVFLAVEACMARLKFSLLDGRGTQTYT
jgi:hypothetical protein